WRRGSIAALGPASGRAPLARTGRGSSRRPPSGGGALRAQVLREEVCAALPGVLRGARVVRGPVIRVEAVPGARIDDDLDVLVVLLQELAHLRRVFGLRVLIGLAVQPEERTVNVLREVESGHRA